MHKNPIAIGARYRTPLWELPKPLDNEEGVRCPFQEPYPTPLSPFQALLYKQ